MRYVIVDMDGASRDYFSGRDDVREALRELEDEHPGIAGDLLVVTYGDDGQQVGEPESAVEVLTLTALEPLVGLGASAHVLAADFWTGVPSAVPLATAASDYAWPVTVTGPSALVPMRPYKYESEAIATAAQSLT